MRHERRSPVARVRQHGGHSSPRNCFALTIQIPEPSLSLSLSTLCPELDPLKENADFEAAKREAGVAETGTVRGQDADSSSDASISWPTERAGAKTAGNTVSTSSSSPLISPSFASQLFSYFSISSPSFATPARDDADARLYPCNMPEIPIPGSEPRRVDTAAKALDPAFECSLHLRPLTPQSSPPPSEDADHFMKRGSAQPPAQGSSKGNNATSFRNLQLPAIDVSLSKGLGLCVELPTPNEAHNHESLDMLVSAASTSTSASQTPTAQSPVLLGPKFPTPALPLSADDANGFVPYMMETARPKAQELQRTQPPSHKRMHGTADSSPHRTPQQSPVLATRTAVASAGDADHSRNVMEKQEAAAPTPGILKRSISMLLSRSSSISRRGTRAPFHRRTPNSEVDGSRTGDASANQGSEASNSPTAPTSAPASATGFRTPKKSPTMRPSDLALALATSQFNTSGTSGTISPLVGNSMVHVKVVMDPSNTVVIPMARTLVLAKARERILTKFFQGGIALVEVKRRKLALRKPDGSLVVIDDNPTWRSIMDSVSYARRQRDHGPVEAPAKDTDRDRSSTKMVDKLTLYLLDADAIAKCQGSARDGGFLEPLPVSPAPAM